MLYPDQDRTTARICLLEKRGKKTGYIKEASNPEVLVSMIHRRGGQGRAGGKPQEVPVLRLCCVRGEGLSQHLGLRIEAEASDKEQIVITNTRWKRGKEPDAA